MLDENGDEIKPPWIPTILIIGAIILGWTLEAILEHFGVI